MQITSSNFNQVAQFLGWKQEIFTAMHMDNLEQYAKHHHDPSKALMWSLAIGAQQPLPKDQNMKLQKNVDFQHLGDSILTLPKTDDKLDVSCDAPSTSEITDILGDNYKTSSQDSQATKFGWLRITGFPYAYLVVRVMMND